MDSKPVMTDQKLLERIALAPKIMAGKQVIRGTRLTVDFILGLLAHGATFDEILAEFEGLEPEDLRACLLFANRSGRLQNLLDRQDHGD